jgi:hypothetical protein
MKPAADTTYVVGGKHVYVTDHASRTVLAEFDDLQLGDAARSESVQKRIGKEGGVGYEGGHLLANMFGGGGEKINIVPMLQEVNRGSGNSFGNLESRLRAHLEGEPSAQIDFKVQADYGAVDRVPSVITASRRSNGGAWEIEEFDNVQP